MKPSRLTVKIRLSTNEGIFHPREILEFSILFRYGNEISSGHCRMLRGQAETFQSVPARCGDRKTLFKVFPHAAATEKHFSKCSCTLRRHFETFQNVPARCGDRKTFFRVFLHAAAAVRNFSKCSCTLRQHFETFRTAPARCGGCLKSVFPVMLRRGKQDSLS
ncbi:MAG: hypothetical protein LBT76_02390 [Tannerella sp.]|nr:hypothetical protein [Tannerella sp.]